MLLHEDPSCWVILDKVESTNSFLLAGDYPSGTVCLAHQQTKGRGQRGRTWASLPGRSFLFSALICSDRLGMNTSNLRDQMPLIPLLIGVSVLAALNTYISSNFESGTVKQGWNTYFQLKWPNDIYAVYGMSPDACPSRAVGVGKLGGILVEGKTISPSQGKHPSLHTCLVLGIGLNWSGAQSLWQSQLPSHAEGFNMPPVALYDTGETSSENEPLSFAPYLITALNRRLCQLQSNQFDFLDEARASFYLQGRIITYADKNYCVKGLAKNGGLILEDTISGVYTELISAQQSFSVLT